MSAEDRELLAEVARARCELVLDLASLIGRKNQRCADALRRKLCAYLGHAVNDAYAMAALLEGDR